MNVRDRWAPAWRGLVIVGLLGAVGCGSDSNVSLDNNAPCGGGSGPKISGVVRLPNGQLARQDGAWQRVASALVAPAEALTGTVQRAGRGVTVELVELRPEDAAVGRQPGAVGRATTNGKGEFCIGLAPGTGIDVCRYQLRVGSAADDTLTRAFVYSADEPIDIDYASEATVHVILDSVPPADLCAFSPDEIRDIHQAVLDVPGSVRGGSVAEVNAVATTLAVADPAVQALAATAGNLPPATATGVPGTPTVTRTSRPTATVFLPSATVTPTGPTRTPTLRPTPTPAGGTATVAPSRTPVPSQTPQPTFTASPTATKTGTATVSATPPPTATFTPTRTPGAALGDRVFTIREDSKFADKEVRVGFFTSALNGGAVSSAFSAGPLVLAAGSTDADGIAPLALKQDAYFRINIPAGGTVLCIRMQAAGSSGRIDCNGGSAFDVTVTAAAGQTAPPATVVTRLGADAGAGAAELTVMQSIGEIASFTAACDASVTFPAPAPVVYTTAKVTATKGVRTLVKTGENFDCAAWTTTDGVGMLVNGVAAYDSRAGGDSASATRLADK